MLYPLLRPLLFALDPETAHDTVFASLDAAAACGVAQLVAPRVRSSPVEVMGLTFPNRVGLAAGLDKNAAHIDGLATMGFGFIDDGVGLFLSGQSGVLPNSDWAQYTQNFNGKMQVSTVRNVDMRPYPTFVKAFMHNGYLKSLKEVVHFYNTRDKFAHCLQGSPGEKVTCWPAPEVLANLDMTVGNLGLTDEEENELVAFMQTLTDGYKP